MAVPEQTPYIEHTGNGATTSFSLGFNCESKDHLIVLVDDIEPPIATWSLTGGNVVFTTAPAAGKKITLQRNTPFSRTTDYQSYNNSFRPPAVNKDFDRLWLKLQELGVADWLMKLYVDRLHQQQEQKINDLKVYVDDRDDELRAYLLEEIRKQGVALDQLDEYYNYLMQRLAQIAVDKGWDASFVVDGNENQKYINDKTIQFLASVSDLKNHKPRGIGQVVLVKSYNPSNNVGGGQFICMQSSVLTEDLGVVFRSSVVGYEDYFWVRINFDVLTPEMCGANGTLQDSTDAIERFLKLCGKGCKGLAVSGKVYKINKGIAATYSTSVNIDFNGASIKPFFNLVAGGGAYGTIMYSHISGDFVENVTVKINNLFIDLTEFTPVVSTSAADRRGVRGLIVNHPETVSINNYKCKGAFYGSGLMLTRYRYANLENIHLPECGMKINPTQDDTGDYDAAGDAIFLVDIIGHGQTTIKNLYAKSQDGYLGRIGVVTEQFAGRTDSHLVTLENAHFEGYHRVIHQEDGGKSRCVWVGGSAKRFSNLTFNLGGVANINYFDAYDLTIDVDPPFTFGGTSGTTCFQGLGDTYYTNCNIRYRRTVSERGNKFVTGGTMTLDSGAAVLANVSTKTHTLTDVGIISNGGYLRFDSGNRGVTVNGGSLTGVSGVMTRVIHSVNGLIKIGGNCKMTDVSVSGENTETIGRDKNTLSDVEIVYTGTTDTYLFNGSYGSAYKLSNVNIKSANARLILYGTATRYSISECEFVNVQIESVNAGTASVNDVCKIKGSEMYYNENYGQASPFYIAAGSLVAVLSGNTFFDATAAQYIALPAETATFKYAAAGNVMIKAAGMTVL